MADSDSLSRLAALLTPAKQAEKESFEPIDAKDLNVSGNSGKKRKRGRPPKARNPRLEKPYQFMRCPTCRHQWWWFNPYGKQATKCPRCRPRRSVRLNDKNSLQSSDKATGEIWVDLKQRRTSPRKVVGGACPHLIGFKHPGSPGTNQTMFSQGGDIWLHEGFEKHPGKIWQRLRSKKQKRVLAEALFHRINVDMSPLGSGGGSWLLESMKEGFVELLLGSDGVFFWNQAKSYLTVHGGSWGNWARFRALLLSKELSWLFEDVSAQLGYGIPNHVMYLKGMNPFIVDNAHLQDLKQFQVAWSTFSHKFPSWQRALVLERVGGEVIDGLSVFPIGGKRTVVAKFVARREALRGQVVVDFARRIRKLRKEGLLKGKLVPIIFCRMAVREVKDMAEGMGILIKTDSRCRRFLRKAELKLALARWGLKVKNALNRFPEISFDPWPFVQWVKKALTDIMMRISGENLIDAALFKNILREISYS